MSIDVHFQRTALGYPFAFITKSTHALACGGVDHSWDVVFGGLNAVVSFTRRGRNGR